MTSRGQACLVPTVSAAAAAAAAGDPPALAASSAHNITSGLDDNLAVKTDRIEPSTSQSTSPSSGKLHTWQL